MSYIESSIAAFEEESEKIGIIIHYPIKSVLDDAKRISAFRAKYILNEKGEPNMDLALTIDEDDLITKILKTWSERIFDEIGSAAKNVPNAFIYEDTKTATVYVDQVAFESGDLFTVDTTLYRCLAETEEAPSDDSIYWFKIEDADVKRIYFTLLMHENWDTNSMSILDKSIFNAMVAAILKEWYVITNREKEEQQYSQELQQNIVDARSATYRRTIGVTSKLHPF